MKTTQKLLTVLALVLGLGSAHAAPVFVQLAMGNKDLNFDSHAWGTDVYSNISFKINDRYTITPETAFAMKYNLADSSFLTLHHKYIRVVLSDRKLAKISDWNLAMSYRYKLPTDLGSQAAGNLGTLLVRPALSKKFGPVSFSARDGVGFNLIRNAYQVNPFGSTPDGNELLSNNLELIFSTELAPEIDASFVLVSGQSVKAAAKGSKGTSWGYSTAGEFEVGYVIKALDGARVAFNVGANGDSGYEGEKGYSFSNQFKWFKKDNAAVNLILEKTF